MNNKDIEFKYFNLNMFRQQTPTGVKCWFAFNPVSLLRQMKPRLLSADERYLHISDFTDLVNAWKTLRAQNNEMVSCDTGCILLAVRINKVALKMTDYNDFLNAKFTLTGVVNSPNPTINSRTIELTGNYLQTFYDVLKKLSCYGKGCFYNEQLAVSLTDVLPIPGQVGAIVVLGHSQIIIRLSNDFWFTYEFKNTVNTWFGTLEFIERLVFSNIPPAITGLLRGKILACRILRNIITDGFD